MKNKSIERCRKLLKPHLKKIIFITMIAIIIDLIEIFKPYLIKVLIDDFLSKGITEKAFLSINKIGIIYIFLVIIGSAFDYYARMKTNTMGEEIIFNIRNKIYEYIRKSKYKIS